MKIVENIKTKVTNWLKTDRKFESGKQLYMRFGRNLSFRTNLNRVGFTKDNYKYLCYELAKLAGISEISYKKMLEIPLVSKAATTSETIASAKIDISTPEEIAQQIEIVNLDELKWKDIQKLVSLLKLKPEGRKKKDLISALANAKMKKLQSIVPDNIKRSIKLRDEFPFLKNKDCPGVLKELVADMLTAYDNYIEGHKKLVEGINQDETQAICKSIVENYIENRQIWEELNYYKKEGKLLGKHPIFDWIKRKAEIHSMKETELIKLRDQLKNKIPRTKKQITDEPDHKETSKRTERLLRFEKELMEVSILLGLNE